MRKIIFFLMMFTSLGFVACSSDDCFDVERNSSFVTRAADDGLEVEAGTYEEMCSDDSASFFITFSWDAGRISQHPYCNLKIKSITSRIVTPEGKGVYERQFVKDSLKIDAPKWSNYGGIEYSFSYVIQMKLRYNDSLVYKRYNVHDFTRTSVPQIVKYDR